MLKKLSILFTTLLLSVSVQAQNAVMVNNSNSVITYPLNFWSANAIQGRAGLGLGSAATSPATAFQPSSTTLSNLAVGNGASLTNLSVTNVSTGILAIANGGTGASNSTNARLALGLGTAATNPSSAFQPASSMLTNLASSNGGSLTNLSVSGVSSGTLSLAFGGTGATNAGTARSNLGATTVGSSVFTLTNPGAITFLRINADNTASALSGSDFRNAIGLGTAATNPSTAFQPATSALTDLSSGDGGSLTNIRATNIVGTIPSSNMPSFSLTAVTGTLALTNGGTGASNAVNARANLGSTTVGDDLFTATNASSARATLGATTVGGNVFTLANPSAIRFLQFNADNTVSTLSATDFRTAIGLDTAATNAASAFQPASIALSNISSGNGFSLTNINATNVTGVVAISNGGSGASNASDARLNLGLGSAATNSASAFQPSSTVLSNLANNNGGSLTNITISNLTGVLATNGNAAGLTNFPAELLRTNGNGAGLTNLNASSITAGTVSVASGGTGATNAETARTNLGLGATWLTNTNVTNFRTAVGLGSEDNVFFNNVETENNIIVGGDLYVTNAISVGTYGITFSSGSDSVTRSNLGLGWSALTNTNTGTGLVSVNTNGEVVSPTNFWQVAPIQTLVQTTGPVTNSTNAATNARNLYVYSLATNIINVTNTITLPTNTSAFNGDEVTVIHRGGSNSVTTVRQLGSTNNLISLNSYDEAVKFIKDGSWDFYHNISFTEAIRFSGTNAAANAAASRTNLGIPSSFGTTTLSAIGGGQSNVAQRNYGVVGGGLQNVNIGFSSVIGGGSVNTILEGTVTLGSVIGGGNSNTINGSSYSVIGGGRFNTNGGTADFGSFIGGGYFNTIDGSYSVVGGGAYNTAASNYSTVIGGLSNSATALYSLAAGLRAKATNNGSFVWADNQNSDFSSTNINSFNVRASGGMSLDLGTNGIIFRTNASAAATRTNLGLPLAALTNTNNANFQEAIFSTNAAPTNAANFNDYAAWMGVSIVTNGVTNVFKIPLYK